MRRLNPPNALTFARIFYIALPVGLYNLHLSRREQQIVDSIEILVTEKTDLDLALAIAAKLDNPDLRAEGSSQLGFSSANVWVYITRGFCRRTFHRLANQVLRGTNGKRAINHLSCNTPLQVNVRQAKNRARMAC